MTPTFMEMSESTSVYTHSSQNIQFTPNCEKKVKFLQMTDRNINTFDVT